MDNHILCHCGNDGKDLNMTTMSLLLNKKDSSNPFPQFLDNFEKDFVNKENLEGKYYCQSDLDFCNFNAEKGDSLVRANDCICSRQWGLFHLEIVGYTFLFVWVINIVILVKYVKKTSIMIETKSKKIQN